MAQERTVDDNMHFRCWLKQRRKLLDLTQHALAERSDCTVGSIRKIEAGQRRPSQQLIERLATALQIPSADRRAFHQLARGQVRVAPFIPLPASSNHFPPTDQTLPTPLTPLIGRDADRATVCDIVRRADVRLLTLIGSPGIGKTRLGLQVAADTRVSFVDGVHWVPLASIRDAQLVLPAIAQALEVHEIGGQTLRDTLVNVLQHKQALLLLDNFEHVTTAASDLVDLLAHAPGLKILVTSQAALCVAGEHIWTVLPLAFPDTRDLPSLDALARYPAIQLFVQQAQAAQQDFVLNETSASVVAAICAQLEGVPLAIELAAARIRLLPLPRLLEQLDQRLALLSKRVADASERHQSLRAAIAWSYELLSAEEQQLLRRLGVFVGGWTLAAAEAVASELRIENEELRKASHKPPIFNSQFSILNSIASLLDKSLIQRLERPDDEPRFTMLESIREFALEQLEASDEARMMHQRHATYYLDWVETVEPQLSGSTQAVWLKRLEAEHDNLRAALAFCLKELKIENAELRKPADQTEEQCSILNSQFSISPQVIGLRLAVGLGLFWHVCGYSREGLAWLETALAQHPDATPALRARGLAHASWFARQQSQYAQAARLAEQSLRLARAADHKQSIALALRTLGGIADCQGNFVQAAQLYEESLAVARQIDDQRHMSEILVFLGYLAKIQGDRLRAGKLYDEALQISRQLGNMRIVVQALMYLGGLALDRGDHRQARALYEESLALAQDLRFQLYIAQVLNGLGEVARLEQDDAQAEIYYCRSLQLARELGVKELASVELHNLGHVALRQHQVVQAAIHFTEGLALGQALGHEINIANALAGLAAVAAALKQPQPAARLLSAATARWEAASYQLDRVDQTAYGHYLATVRAQSDRATFDAAWADGQALPLEQAIAEAQAIADAAQSVPDGQPPSVTASHPASLSEREVEVLRLLTRGLTDPQIAEQLMISPRTVHAHLRTIYKKLEVPRRSAATRFAVEHNLV
jgi:predicted ATPase/DNA-binding CsgD family transcriptional regulator/transcriptional regulator with XRE-family HTH domain